MLYRTDVEPGAGGGLPPDAGRVRPQAHGKFLFVGDRKLYVRGVTYGTFAPGADGEQYPDRAQVEYDFTKMREAGFNALRTYTPPPRWLLDLAADADLLVMAGLPWEHHVAFLDEPGRARSIEERVRGAVAACAGHPAVLCYAVGNEIPSAIVRWQGRERTERYLERLCEAVREEDPGCLVTYVNFPPTEYLRLSAVDLLCFNVYLEHQERLDAYLARLQNLAGERPLLMAELGLDSRRNGTHAQARVLDWQLETAFSAGCAGAFVFAWTDDWYVQYLSPEGKASGGAAIEDWDFGLTDRRRRPKPALATVSRRIASLPFSREGAWPRMSVVVCTHNGERTLRFCLDGIARLSYPDFEVIVIDDGSTDGTAAIASEYDVRLIRTPNRGLSAARNAGAEAATGEIVVYIDDDASPDPHWLWYLAATFRNTDHAAVGGPNIPPPPDTAVADCIANAPGGPVCVLLSDRKAEHIPGCNMAIRKESLAAIGGFDLRFRVAGDDVDVCWRLQNRGLTIGHDPAAVVWHHRRRSLSSYWRQQCGYGRAEALLERKWPQRYNSAGHVSWGGRVYGRGGIAGLGRRRVYQGIWGSRLFQSLYEPAPQGVWSLPLMPEWYLVLSALAVVALAGTLWTPLLAALAPLAAALGMSLVQAGASARRASFARAARSRPELAWRRALTTLLFLVQPLARLRGRAGDGLTLWRSRGPRLRSLPRRRTLETWHERWTAPHDRLRAIEDHLRRQGSNVQSGGAFDRWDLAVRCGPLAGGRLLAAVEEHGAGRQLMRIRCWPTYSPRATVTIAVLTAATLLALIDGALAASAILALALAGLTLRVAMEGASAVSAVVGAVEAGAERQSAEADDGGREPEPSPAVLERSPPIERGQPTEAKA